MTAKYPDHAVDFAADMAKIDPDWLKSRSIREWCYYLGNISKSNFAMIKAGSIRYSTNRRKLLESMAGHVERAQKIERKIERRGQADLPAKLENYIIQQNTEGRYVLSRVVATFLDKREAEQFSSYINRMTK